MDEAGAVEQHVDRADLGRERHDRRGIGHVEAARARSPRPRPASPRRCRWRSPRAPSRANSSAAARPIPWAAAVTTARLPSSLPLMSSSLAPMARSDARPARPRQARPGLAGMTAAGAQMRRCRIGRLIAMRLVLLLMTGLLAAPGGLGADRRPGPPGRRRRRHGDPDHAGRGRRRALGPGATTEASPAAPAPPAEPVGQGRRHRQGGRLRHAEPAVRRHAHRAHRTDRQDPARRDREDDELGTGRRRPQGLHGARLRGRLGEPARRRSATLGQKADRLTRRAA